MSFFHKCGNLFQGLIKKKIKWFCLNSFTVVGVDAWV